MIFCPIIENFNWNKYYIIYVWRTNSVMHFGQSHTNYIITVAMAMAVVAAMAVAVVAVAVVDLASKINTSYYAGQ